MANSTQECQECGKSFTRASGKKKFCSRKCFGLETSREKKRLGVVPPSRKGKSSWNKGISRVWTEAEKLLLRKPHPNQQGEKHYNWKGGISKNPYPKEFSWTLKKKIRERDNFTCCRCGRTEREELEELNRVLCVNHIDFNKDNCNEDNLNTLCVRCNVGINRDRDYWTNYFQTQ